MWKNRTFFGLIFHHIWQKHLRFIEFLNLNLKWTSKVLNVWKAILMILFKHLNNYNWLQQLLERRYFDFCSYIEWQIYQANKMSSIQCLRGSAGRQNSNELWAAAWAILHVINYVNHKHFILHTKEKDIFILWITEIKDLSANFILEGLFRTLTA